MWNEKHEKATKKVIELIKEKNFEKKVEKLEREVELGKLYYTNFYEDIRPLLEVEKILIEDAKEEEKLQKSILKLALNKNKSISLKKMTGVFEQLLEASANDNSLLDDEGKRKHNAVKKAINACQEKLKAAGANSHLFSGSARVAKAMMARAEQEGLVTQRRDSVSSYYKDEGYFGSMPSQRTERQELIQQVSETRESHETDTPLPEKDPLQEAKETADENFMLAVRRASKAMNSQRKNSRRVSTFK